KKEQADSAWDQNGNCLTAGYLFTFAKRCKSNKKLCPYAPGDWRGSWLAKPSSGETIFCQARRRREAYRQYGERCL
ncbi:MAG: hypothetical protein E6X17_18200, partial [Sporomusaceae bacterium]|nr:hypothetical protein [Sporomusaceae bacterium]